MNDARTHSFLWSFHSLIPSVSFHLIWSLFFSSAVSRREGKQLNCSVWPPSIHSPPPERLIGQTKPNGKETKKEEGGRECIRVAEHCCLVSFLCIHPSLSLKHLFLLSNGRCKKNAGSFLFHLFTCTSIGNLEGGEQSGGV